jgi:hypothetical protein
VPSLDQPGAIIGGSDSNGSDASFAVPVGSMSRSPRRDLIFGLPWLALSAAAAVIAIAFAMLAVTRPLTVIYTTTDLTQLPLTAAALPSERPTPCVSLALRNGAATLIDQQCGSPASTFRVIGRVSDVAQCVRDADLTYSWSSGSTAGAACLDYDWTVGQCLHIAGDDVRKVDCGQRGAVRPEKAVIGAVDVSYCLGGGLAHRVRHFTVCTQAGDKDCKGKTRDT